MQSGYFHHPVLGRNKIFFLSENSLWSVPIEGGIAKRLVYGQGIVSFPLVSPDQKWLIYAFNEEGANEVYIMSTEGGEANRLTYHCLSSSPAGWHQDSQSLYFRSTRQSPFYNKSELFKIFIHGGNPEPLNWGPAIWINFHPDGKMAVIGKNRIDLASWKKYRGGTTGCILIGNIIDYNFKKLIDHPAGHVLPQFYNNRIYFISDRDGIGSIYSTDLSGEDLSRHTFNQDFYARNLNVSSGKAVYQMAGDIYLLDLTNQQDQKIEIELNTPLKIEKTYFISPKKYIERIQLAKNGRNTLLNIRGKQINLPVKSGAVRYIGCRQGVRYRLSQYLNDEGDILCLSDQSGEEVLEIHHINYLNPPKGLGKIPTGGHITYLKVSHDGKHAVVGTNRKELYLVNLEPGLWEFIDTSKYTRNSSLVHWCPVWSPDDRYIAYSKVEDLKYSIFVYDTKEKEIIRITDSEFDDLYPDFDPTGKYLYFSSERFLEPYIDHLDTNFAYLAPMKPYIVILDPNTPVPFYTPHEKEIDEEDENSKKVKKEKNNYKVKIDKNDISNRIFEFPEIEASDHCIVYGLKDKALIASWPIKGAFKDDDWTNDENDNINLDIYDFTNNTLENYLTDISDFSLSSNKEWLIYKKKSIYRVLKIGEKPNTGSNSSSKNDKNKKMDGTLDLNKIKINIDLKKEWQQIYVESWRYQREHFWDQSMSGIDWNLIKNKYQPLLDKINTREELMDLISEMQGELGTSHAYCFGGDLEKNKNYNVGVLGTDFIFDFDKGLYQFSKIYPGDSFYKNQFSPLSMPGINIKPGDYLHAINGEFISQFNHPYQYLINQVETEVVLLISNTGNQQEAREVTVKTLSSEYPLRYREWVKNNIHYVAEQTDHKVGYLHIPDMSIKGVIEFDRYFYQYIYKEGIIIDIRGNGGGFVSQTLLQKLYRQLVGFVKSRWEGRESTIPDYTFRGSLVVIIDEFSGSDADIFPQAFKNLKMGSIIGKRTWGGVVGINVFHSLVDSGVVTQPEYFCWFKEQGYKVENYGVDPDIEIENDPKSVYNGVDNQLETAIIEIKKLMKKNKYYKPKL